MSAPVGLPPPPGVRAASAYPPVTRLRAVLAVTGTTLAYLVALGPYVVTAVLVLLGRRQVPATTGGAERALGLALALLATGLLVGLGATALLGRATVRDWCLGRRSGRRGAVVVPAAWFVGSLLVGTWGYLAWSVVTAALRRQHGTPPADPLSGVLWFDLVRALVAGPQEELVVVALPLVVAARLGGTRLRPGHPPVWLWVLLVAARLAYHVYYGPGVWALLAWAVVVPWLFWRTRQVWPLVLTHSAYDALVVLASRASPGLALLVLPLGLLVLLVAAAVLRARVRPEQRWSLRRVAPANRGVVPQDLRRGPLRGP